MLSLMLWIFGSVTTVMTNWWMDCLQIRCFSIPNLNTILYTKITRKVDFQSFFMADKRHESNFQFKIFCLQIEISIWNKLDLEHKKWVPCKAVLQIIRPERSRRKPSIWHLKLILTSWWPFCHCSARLGLKQAQRMRLVFDDKFQWPPCKIMRWKYIPHNK